MNKKSKSNKSRFSIKTLIGVLAVSQVAPLSSVSAVSLPFSDVPEGYWASPAITSLKTQGIIAGRSSSIFAPNDTITRAEFTIILVKSLKLPIDDSSSQEFQDVNTNHYAYKYIQTAFKNNLIAGTAPNRFDPNALISRQDIATMIMKALQIKDVPESLVQTALSFVDANKIRSYAKEPVAASRYLNVISGYEDQSFRPLNHASRAEASSMINSMMNIPYDKIQQLKDMSNTNIETVEITPNPILLGVGESVQLTAKAFGRNQQPIENVNVTWSLSGDFGSISNGTLTASKTGSGTVTATVQKDGQEPVTATANVTVEVPKHLTFSQNDYGTYTPAQPFNMTVQVKDDQGQIVSTDNNRKLTITVNGPDGQSTLDANTVNGQANFTLNKTKAGTYSVSVAGASATADGTASFTVIPGVLSKLNIYVSPSPFVHASSTVDLIGNGYDQWDNAVQVPVSFSVNDSRYGSISQTNNPSVAQFTAENTNGNVTVTAKYAGYSVSKQIHVYTSSTELVSGKGDWMMWRDWKNYPVQDTIKRLKDANVTHVFLLVSTTKDGFFGQDSMDDFLHQAHDAGIVVIGWVYTAMADPYKDADQTLQVLKYTTPTGQRFDGLAADLEENLYAWQQEEFAKAIRNQMGPNYLMTAVVYPATWGKSQPWDVYTKYYDVMAPMDYWHFREKEYSYQEVYDAIAAEIVKMREVTRADMPIHMIGQSYNMFPNNWNMNPTWAEIQGAMRAAKDGGAIGYSTYRGRTATYEGWNEFAAFEW